MNLHFSGIDVFDMGIQQLRVKVSFDIFLFNIPVTQKRGKKIHFKWDCNTGKLEITSYLSNSFEDYRQYLLSFFGKVSVKLDKLGLRYWRKNIYYTFLTGISRYFSKNCVGGWGIVYLPLIKKVYTKFSYSTPSVLILRHLIVSFCN